MSLAVWAVLVVSVFNPLVAVVFRAFWYEWLLERPLREIEAGRLETGDGDDPWLPRDELALYRQRYAGRHVRAALFAGGLGLVGSILFVYTFIPLTLEQFREL